MKVKPENTERKGNGNSKSYAKENVNENPVGSNAYSILIDTSVVILLRKVSLTATSNIMTKSEFQKLQVKAASSGTTLKEFLRSEGVAYPTYKS